MERHKLIGKRRIAEKIAIYSFIRRIETASKIVDPAIPNNANLIQNNERIFFVLGIININKTGTKTKIPEIR